LNLSGGTLGGSQTVTVLNSMSWTGGTMTGAGRTVIPSSVTLTIANPDTVSLASRTLDNGGTVMCSGSTFTMNGGVVTNEPGALFQVQNPYSFSLSAGSPRFDNAGTFRNTGSGTANFFNIDFNNYNLVDIQGGILAFDGGGTNTGAISVPAGTTLNLGNGTFSASSGSVISGAGNLTVSGGGQTLAGAVNLGGSNVFSGGSIEVTGNYVCTNNTMTLSGGTASFDGIGKVSPAVLNLSSGTLTGSNVVTALTSMSWTSGTMAGTGRTVIPSGATLTIANPGTVSFVSRTLDNGGTVICSGSSVAINGGVFTNEPAALFQVQNPYTFAYNGGAPRFDNAGTFRPIGIGTTTIRGGIPFTNYGTVDIQNGFLAADGGYVSSSNAVLNCALAGAVAGTNYGQLQVFGSLNLNGTLSVNLTNNYVPTTNDLFTVLTAGTRNGSFASFVYPSNKVTMVLSNTAASVIVRANAIVSLPQPFLLLPQLAGSNVVLTWTTVSNGVYRLQSNPGLASSNWAALPGDVTALSNTATKTDLLTPSNRFYRVLALPP
jgi:hypothetical protein